MISNQDIVINAIPNWRPTYYIQSFGIKAIQRIVKCDIKEAVDILETLHYINAVPKIKWSDNKKQ